MKQLMILTCILLTATSVTAQVLSQTGGKIYIGAAAGPSFPLADFADDNPESKASGYATTGYKLEISGGIRLINIFEISIMGFRNVNPTDPANLRTAVNSQNPANNYNVQTDDWEMYGAFGGLGISYPLPKKFIMDVRIMGGYINVKSPEILLTTPLPDVYYKVEGKTVSTLGYFTSLTVRYPVITKLFALVGFEYLAAIADFNDVKTISSIEGAVTESTASFQRTLQAWTITAGLKFFIL